ncbi:amidase family protein [Kineococcus sp. NUM-3379]
MDVREYAEHDATGLARLVAEGQVTPAELAQAALSAVEEVDRHLNAVVETWEPDPEDLVRSAPGSPLAGVPFLVKDLGVTLAGRRSEWGSRLAEGLTAPGDSFLARRFRRAGLVTIGRTATPELAMSTSTESVLHGATRNPWSPAHTAGGSSGGAAAAVSARVVPLAHATDAAGSIRIPAALTGLVGLKPTRGRVSSGPAVDEVFNGLGVQLGLTRSVRDTAALLDIAAGPEAGEPYTIAAPQERYADVVTRDPGRLRIALVVEGWGRRRTDSRVAAAVTGTARLLESLGHDVEAAAVPLGVGWEEFVAANATIWAANLVPLVDTLAAATGRVPGPATLEPHALAAYRDGRRLSAAQLLLALDVRNRVTRSVGAFFGRHDVLLTPTVPDGPAPLGVLHEDAGDLGAVGWVDRMLDGAPFTPVFNVTGLPAVSLPVGGPQAPGTPVGIQLAAAFGREDVLLSLAAQLERAAPWADRVPPVAAGR